MRDEPLGVVVDCESDLAYDGRLREVEVGVEDQIVVQLDVGVLCIDPEVVKLTTRRFRQSRSPPEEPNARQAQGAVELEACKLLMVLVWDLQLLLPKLDGVDAWLVVLRSRQAVSVDQLEASHVLAPVLESLRLSFRRKRVLLHVVRVERSLAGMSQGLSVRVLRLAPRGLLRVNLRWLRLLLRRCDWLFGAIDDLNEFIDGLLILSSSLVSI